MALTGILAAARPAAADHDLFNSFVTISDASRCESSNGGFDVGALGFKVTLDHHATDSTIKVNYTTSAVTATAGSDYQVASGTLTFNPGQSQKNIAVLVKNDAEGEPNETFNVKLSGVTGPGSLMDNTGKGTILDDDPGKVHIGDDAGPETGSRSFKVTRCGSVAAGAIVNYTTANSTAISGSDYVARSGSLAFAADVRVKTVAVNVIDDWQTEPEEKFRVVLSNPVGAVLGDNAGAGTIWANDPS